VLSGRGFCVGLITRPEELLAQWAFEPWERKFIYVFRIFYGNFIHDFQPAGPRSENCYEL
jgi:hypothetical protein